MKAIRPIALALALLACGGTQHPTAPTIEDLRNRAAAAPADATAGATAHRFRGYELDARRRPMLRYQIERAGVTVAVTEAIVARPWHGDHEPAAYPPEGPLRAFCAQFDNALPCGVLSWRELR